MFHGLGLGIDGLPNPLLDPLFMRPPPGVLDPNGLFMNNILGIPGGDPYMGGRALPGGADRPGQPPNALENSLFNHYQRNQVQVQTNLNDELGQQLLETMDVQFEEVKEPEVQPLAQKTATEEINKKSASESKDWSNDQLLSEFFAPMQSSANINNPSAAAQSNVAAGSGGDMIQSSVAAGG